MGWSRALIQLTRAAPVLLTPSHFWDMKMVFGQSFLTPICTNVNTFLLVGWVCPLTILPAHSLSVALSSSPLPRWQSSYHLFSFFLLPSVNAAFNLELLCSQNQAMEWPLNDHGQIFLPFPPLFFLKFLRIILKCEHQNQWEGLWKGHL